MRRSSSLFARARPAKDRSAPQRFSNPSRARLSAVDAWGDSNLYLRRNRDLRGNSEEPRKAWPARTWPVPFLAWWTTMTAMPWRRTPELVDIDEGDVNQLADRFIAATKADIRKGGSKACFVPSQDFIAMPPREAFEQQLLVLIVGQTLRCDCSGGYRSASR